jgi:hypothetical protein
MGRIIPGFDMIRLIILRLDHLIQVIQDLLTRRRNTGQDPIRSRDQLKRLANRVRAHRSPPHLVFEAFCELLQSGRLKIRGGRVLLLQKLDIVEDLVDLLVGKAFYFPKQALPKDIMHGLRLSLWCFPVSLTGEDYWDSLATSLIPDNVMLCLSYHCARSP